MVLASVEAAVEPCVVSPVDPSVDAAGVVVSTGASVVVGGASQAAPLKENETISGKSPGAWNPKESVLPAS